ncbi:MAG: hypothetical protein RR942_04020 [Romboutsia sp.]
MDQTYIIAEKTYYFYKKLPNFVQKFIKIIYFLLKKIYLIIRCIYRNLFKKVNRFTKMQDLELISDNNVVYKDDYYIDNKKPEKNKLNISWVIPLPIEGSGGHRNFFRVIKFLSLKGHHVTVYIDPQKFYLNNGVKTGKDAQKFIKNSFFDLNSDVIMGTNDIKQCDILFATHYSGSYIVKSNESKARLCCYFIQDYEAYFNPMGDDFIRAYQSYKLGLYPITSGPWPLNFLKNEFGIKEGFSFLFPINKDVYFFNNFKEKILNRIIFFAKPFMPRRCYKLGIEALTIIKKLYPKIEVVLYGSNSNDYQNIPFEFINMGLLPTINDLGNLYRSAEIGMVFSTTNPSLVPFEMMSCGCSVIDIDFNNNIINYDNNNNVTLANSSPEDVANKILFLLKNKNIRIQKAKNGIEFCKKFPTEKEMCEGIEKKLMNTYKKRNKKNEKQC